MLLKPYHTPSNNKRKKPVSDVLTKAIKIIIIHSKYFPDSDWLVSDDQIWKNFVFNVEMTSKIQRSCKTRRG